MNDNLGYMGREAEMLNGKEKKTDTNISRNVRKTHNVLSLMYK